MARGIVYPRIGPGGATVPVRLPKGSRTLSPDHVAAIDRMGQRISTSKNCVIVFFGKGRKKVAAQRCEGRKLKAHNRKQCRGKKRQFIKCSRRR